MKHSAVIATVLISIVSVVSGRSREPSNMGQEAREIKSLAPHKVQSYLSGHGMGFAKAAELNHHPGPKHVIELAENLGLTNDQMLQTRQIYGEMHREASRLGQVLVDLEKRLDRMFAENAAAEDQMHDLISRISRVRGEIRFAHLKAHLQMVKVLGSDQIDRYDELRGYSEGSKHHGHEQRPGH